ncbi:hypothetical protein GCK72_008094 [Caenorhabditis remanei]|uniref:Uncharacterized protein n=1 Tax=Caenorhabditis remanei TaxID=31234 RepID=A0A6A5HQQ8_CAERE|nr:hypothetical protein GCK72_008094 [Caenorhabditis remanei]KAF1768132.1 hypothetical protein GCK72_008094 [Caenorhabditis remanei]
MWSLENVIGSKTQDYELEKSKFELERSLHETFKMLIIEELEMEKKEKINSQKSNFEALKTEACRNTISLLKLRDDYVHILHLNNSIEYLKELHLEAIQIFNRSIQYLGSKRKESNLTVLRSYLEELELLMRTIKWQVQEIERNGKNVRSFHGVGKLQRSSDYVEKWICVFLLQIKRNRITWNFEKVDKFTEEMKVFCRNIYQVQFVTLNYKRVREQFIGRQEITRL